MYQRAKKKDDDGRYRRAKNKHDGWQVMCLRCDCDVPMMCLMCLTGMPVTCLICLTDVYDVPAVFCDVPDVPDLMCLIYLWCT